MQSFKVTFTPWARILLTSLCVLTIAACSSLKFPGVFRIDVGQGNIITSEMISKLKVGMTKKQVEYVTGSAMIKDPFSPNRWDYVYSYETGHGALVENRLSLYFSGERLERIDNNQLKDPDQQRDQLHNIQLKERGIKPQKAISQDEIDAAKKQGNPDNL